MFTKCNCCCEHLGVSLTYTTRKELQVQNRFIAGVHLFGILVIAIYVILYTLILNQGYQLVSYPTGYVSTKVKGITFNPAANLDNGVYFDASDLVIPALEMNGLFLTT